MVLDRCSRECERNNPQSAGELYRGADDQRLRPISCCCADHGTGVVNRQRGPQSELRLERCNAFPIGEKISSATEFKIKIVPSDTAISSSSACRIGPIAAMALPPQMAVPAVIKNDELPRTCKSLPSARPVRSAKEIPSAV